MKNRALQPMENYYRRCGKKDAKPKEHNTRVGEYLERI